MTGSESSTSIVITVAERIGWIVAFAGALGVAGFIAGFFGPIVHHPHSNQGPLAGIFITGPFGVVLGTVAGLIVPFLTSKPRRIIVVLLIATIIYGGGLWLAYAFTRDPGTGSAPTATAQDQNG